MVPFPVSSPSLPLPLLLLLPRPFLFLFFFFLFFFLFFSSLARPAIGSQSKVTQQETPGSMYNQDMGKYGTIPDQRPCMNR